MPWESSHFWSWTDQLLREAEEVCLGQLKWQGNWNAFKGIYVVWNIWSSLFFSLENSWWNLAVHQSTYHQCFVIICRNSHKRNLAVTFYIVISSGISTLCPRQMQIPKYSFSVLRRKSKQSWSLIDELSCHCSLAPLAPERHLTNSGNQTSVRSLHLQ